VVVVSDIPEQNVQLTKPDLSAAERVQEAVGCLPQLPARLEATLAADAPSPQGLRRWTVRDFHDAYRSGETTPVQVDHASLSCVLVSSSTALGPCPDSAAVTTVSCAGGDEVPRGGEGELGPWDEHGLLHQLRSRRRDAAGRGVHPQVPER